MRSLVPHTSTLSVLVRPLGYMLATWSSLSKARSKCVALKEQPPHVFGGVAFWDVRIEGMRRCDTRFRKRRLALPKGFSISAHCFLMLIVVFTLSMHPIYAAQMVALMVAPVDGEQRLGHCRDSLIHLQNIAVGFESREGCTTPTERFLVRPVAVHHHLHTSSTSF